MAATKLIGLVALLLLATASTEAQRRSLHYQPEKVALTGRLVYRTFYGPPGYGENPKTDKRETQSILILESAIDVIGNGNDPWEQTEHGIKRITLVVDRSSPFVGKRVVVEGTLFHAHTGHHHTKVLMEVSSIRNASRG
ncbi:MAG TPA: DUF4431 domain-containing protein [Pyrinomonadaceae bacterium]|jgi:hypothetical protein